MIYNENSNVLYEQLVNKLEKQIADGTLKGGDKLPSENTLAKENNISRVTVRQALKLLTEIGLIETKKGIGSFVVDSDLQNASDKVSEFMKRFEDNFNQAMQIKILIEPSIAAHVALHGNPQQIKKMEDLWSQMTVSMGKKQYNELCIEFHLALIAAVGNPILLDFYRKLEDMEQMYLRDLLLPRELSRTMRIADIEQHGNILRAIKDQSPDLAYLHCKEHLKYFHQSYSEVKLNNR